MQGGHDNGLKYIQKFAWFYYHNEYGIHFVKGSPGREITQQFARERDTYMDSRESTDTVEDWMK